MRSMWTAALHCTSGLPHESEVNLRDSSSIFQQHVKMTCWDGWQRCEMHTEPCKIVPFSSVAKVLFYWACL